MSVLWKHQGLQDNCGLMYAWGGCGLGCPMIGTWLHKWQAMLIPYHRQRGWLMGRPWQHTALCSMIWITCAFYLCFHVMVYIIDVIVIICSNAYSMDTQKITKTHFDGILPKGPYPPCLCMADRALFAGYPWFWCFCINCHYVGKSKCQHTICLFCLSRSKKWSCGKSAGL